MPENNVDIRSENLDEFLLKCLNDATPAQIEKIPMSLIGKVLKRGGWKLSERLTGLEALKIIDSLGGDIAILIRSKIPGGIDSETLVKYNKVAKGESGVGILSEDQHDRGYFVLGGSELMETVRYMHLASITKYYRLVRKLGSTPTGLRPRGKVEFNRVMKWFANGFREYEANKKTMFHKYKLQHADFYALLFFYDKDGDWGDFQNSKFKNAFASSEFFMKRALRNTVAAGLIQRVGIRRKYRYIITAKGKELVEEFFKGFMT